VLESAGDDDDDDDDDDDTRRRAYVHVRLYARGHIHDARRTTRDGGFSSGWFEI
jgi:hypothetical protein